MALTCRVLAASVPAAPPAPVLPAGGRYLSAGEQLQVQGQPMTGWIFEAPGDIREIAKWLSNQLPALRDLLVAPGLVVLSGMDAQSHWSARLTDGGRGWVQGTLSHLPLDQESRAPLPPVPWQPEGARLHFDVRWREARVTGAQQVWTHGATPADLRQRLRVALQREGWRASEADTAFPGRWFKASAQLSVVVVEQPPGSAIVTVLDWRE
ncbi:hypothetical protein [Bordetella sp. LUAb4]|uniref:hypothetical protein n=1 Tax=Bordetella sp. LUAb4 TaxID=2843195 RepID=UPI001E4D9D7D|nr:hypothetical protein [Bordetella sp. LUAb4]